MNGISIQGNIPHKQLLIDIHIKNICITTNSTTYRQQTPRGILNGDGIHKHLYRIQMYTLVSGTEIDAYKLVTVNEQV